MKKYLLLLVGLIIITCSKDDDNSNNNSDAETFVQRFDGLGFSNSEGDVYFYFYNANTFMKHVGRYDDNSTESFSVNEDSNIEKSDSYEFNISIITNENNVLFF